MNWNALGKPAVKLLVQIAVAACVYALLRSSGLHDITAAETEGFNTVTLLLGSIYAVMFAFAIFVIWGQFTEVENCVLRECNELDDLYRFGGYASADASRSIQRALSDYARHVVRFEWQALAEDRRDPQSEKLFSELVDCVVRIAPASPIEQTIHPRLIDIVRKAGEHRDERIAKSLARIPPTLVWLVRTMAAAILLMVVAYPFHHWLAGLFCVGLVVIVLGMADFVMMDTDNPFQGVCNLSPKRFTELARS